MLPLPLPQQAASAHCTGYPSALGCPPASSPHLTWGGAACPLQADWNIVRKGWEAHVLGEAPNRFTDAYTAIKTLRVGALGPAARIGWLGR